MNTVCTSAGQWPIQLSTVQVLVCYALHSVCPQLSFFPFHLFLDGAMDRRLGPLKSAPIGVSYKTRLLRTLHRPYSVVWRREASQRARMSLAIASWP